MNNWILKDAGCLDIKLDMGSGTCCDHSIGRDLSGPVYRSVSSQVYTHLDTALDVLLEGAVCLEAMGMNGP